MRSLTFFALAFVLACSENESSSSTSTNGSNASTSASARASAAPTPAPGDVPAPPDVAAPPADATKTASGLASKVLTPGTGKEHPGPRDRVKVLYTGWQKSGAMFDTSRGVPMAFGVGEVIKGWTEGLQLMVVGEKRRLWIPAALAYG